MTEQELEKQIAEHVEKIKSLLEQMPENDSTLSSKTMSIMLL